MPEKMPDRMSEYTSDVMPDIISVQYEIEHQLTGDHSKKVVYFGDL